MERIEIYASKWRNILLLVGGIIFLVASLVILQVGMIAADLMTHGFFFIVGLLGTFLFGYGLVFFIKQLFNQAPVIILDESGFCDRTSALSAKGLMISWAEVDQITCQSLNRQTFVSIYLKDNRAYMAELTPIQRKITQANIKLGFGEITISLNLLKGCQAEQLAQLMQTYLDFAQN